MPYHTEYLHRNKIKLNVFQFVFLYIFAYIAQNFKTRYQIFCSSCFAKLAMLSVLNLYNILYVLYLVIKVQRSPSIVFIVNKAQQQRDLYLQSSIESQQEVTIKINIVVINRIRNYRALSNTQQQECFFVYQILLCSHSYYVAIFTPKQILIWISKMIIDSSDKFYSVDTPFFITLSLI